jgi:hypothetical protein
MIYDFRPIYPETTLLTAAWTGSCATFGALSWPYCTTSHSCINSRSHDISIVYCSGDI